MSQERGRGVPPRPFRGDRGDGTSAVKALFQSDGDAAEDATVVVANERGVQVDLKPLHGEVKADLVVAEAAQAEMLKAVQKNLRTILDELPLDSWKYDGKGM